ncbi:MAG: hypothetical protein R6U70_06555 [Bacillota bacterium]
MREDFTGWLAVIFIGVILGFLTMTRWSPYDDYAPVAVDEWVLAAACVLGGAIVVLLFEEGPQHAVAAGVLLVSAVFFPVVATIITSHLLGTTAVLDIIIYAALQRGLGRAIQLFVCIVLGVALGMFARMRVRL